MIIKLDTPFAIKLGFTSDKFHPLSYLSQNKREIVISAIQSLKKGNFRILVDNILKNGYSICVPCPFQRMRDICVKNGYKREMRYEENCNEWFECFILGN